MTRSDPKASAANSTEWLLGVGGVIVMIFASAFVLGGGLIVGALMSLLYYRGNRTAQVRALLLGTAVSIVVLVVFALGLYLSGHSSGWVSPPTTVHTSS